jgi:hypothetical protein
MTDLSVYQYYNMQWDVTNCKLYENTTLKLTNGNYTYTTAKYLCLYEGSNSGRNVIIDWIFVRNFDPSGDPIVSWLLYMTEDLARDYQPTAIPNHVKRGRSRVPANMRWIGRRLSRLANQIEIDPPYDKWWNGQIITVGPVGRDFYSPYDAINYATNGALILLDPGMYTHAIYSRWIQGPWCTKDCIIRGMGSSAWDTIINIDTAYGPILDQGWYHVNDTRILWENFRFRMYSTSWFQQLELYSANQVTHMNKIIFHPGNSTIYGICGQSAWNSGANSELLIQNGYLIKGYNHFGSTNLAKVRIRRTYLDTTLSGGSGTLAEADYVTATTADYGPNFGKYLVRGISNDINNAVL